MIVTTKFLLLAKIEFLLVGRLDCRIPHSMNVDCKTQQKSSIVES